MLLDQQRVFEGETEASFRDRQSESVGDALT